MRRGATYLCGVCAASRRDGAGNCAECGSELVLEAVNGFVSAFPAGTAPCPSCGSSTQALAFRGWARLIGFIFWARETRGAAYVCRPCAEKQTAITLLLNSLLGWWSFPSLFFSGWRALYHNWRSVWTTPLNPGAWGAIDAELFAQVIREDRAAAFAAAAEEVLAASPFRFLTRTQQGIVLAATGLYELLGVGALCSPEELRAAYRAKCKQVHPDLQHGSAAASEEMIRLNNAWEILRSDRMRAAYDWLEKERGRVQA
jgi:hypothetical protein